MLRILLTVLLLVTTLGGARGDTPLNFGWNPPKTAPQLNPVWEQQLDDLVQYNDDSDALLYRFLYKALKDTNLLNDWEKETGRLKSLNQKNVGSCTSYATSIALDVTRACDVYIRKEPELFKARINPEAMYGIGRLDHLGGWDGAVTAWMAEGAIKYGTLHHLKYEPFDLTNTEPVLGREWASRGIPEDLLKFAADHKLISFAMINSLEEARAALLNGYAISTGAQVSYPSTRDENGISRRNGRQWAHAQGIIAYRKSPESYLQQNSWAGWNNGPISPTDQPEGSYWITPEDFLFQIKQGDTFAIGPYDGFKKRPLKWSEVFRVGEEVKENE